VPPTTAAADGRGARRGEGEWPVVTRPLLPGRGSVGEVECGGVREERAARPEAGDCGDARRCGGEAATGRVRCETEPLLTDPQRGG